VLAVVVERGLDDHAEEAELGASSLPVRERPPSMKNSMLNDSRSILRT